MRLILVSIVIELSGDAIEFLEFGMLVMMVHRDVTPT
jgi:hypothetical protein